MIQSNINKTSGKNNIDKGVFQSNSSDPEQVLKSSLAKNSKLKIGDLNGDGKFDAEDIKIFKEYLEGKRELSEEEKERADVNNDGKVDNEDLYKLIRRFEERRETETRVRELEALYQALLQNENEPAGFVVLGVNNSNLDSVKIELGKARALLSALS